MDNVQDYIKNQRKLGYSDQQIKQELIKSGWSEDGINKYFNAKIAAAKEILDSNPKYKLFQKIAVGWLIAYLILKVIYAFLVILEAKAGIKVTIFGIAFNFVIILPAIIILIGLLKVKAWAYIFYLIGLFSSLWSFGQAKNNAELIFGIILSFGSLIVLILTTILYRKIFPSKKSQASQKINQ